MTSITKYLKLLRVHQWYKNLVIFLALFFSNNLFELDLLLNVLVGFFALCFISSSYYILNDLRDIKEDKKHPEKNKRPIPSGEIKKEVAIIISVCLFIASLLISYMILPLFIIFPLILFTLTNIYSIYLKHIAIIDIHIIAFNFLIRALAGVFLTSTPLSPWMVMLVFLIALFLAIGKRRSELYFLGDDAKDHKRVYHVYNKKFLDMMTTITLTLLLFSYILYTFMAHENRYMMVTIPIVSFLIFRYLYFISINHKIARKTEYLFRDPQMVMGLCLWVLVSFLVLYII